MQDFARAKIVQVFWPSDSETGDHCKELESMRTKQTTPTESECSYFCRSLGQIEPPTQTQSIQTLSTSRQLFMHTEKPLLFEQFACHDSHLGKAIGRDEKNGYRNLAVKDPTFSRNRKMVLHDLSYIYIYYDTICVYIYIWPSMYIYNII